MNKVDFTTDKIIIFCYPCHAGGKFLINSIGLSDSAVFQDSVLADKQISGQFSKEHKFSYLTSKIQSVTDRWNDLDLGCGQLFNVSPELYFETPVNIKFNDVIPRIIDNQLYFFLVAHRPLLLQQYLKFWINAKVVILENYNHFINDRIRQRFWRRVKHQNWPETSPRSFRALELLENFDYDKALADPKFSYFCSLIARNDVFDREMQEFKILEQPKWLFYWNTEWFFSKDDTIREISRLYQYLNLTDFNKDYIEQYYDMWTNKLNELK